MHIRSLNPAGVPVPNLVIILLMVAGSYASARRPSPTEREKQDGEALDPKFYLKPGVGSWYVVSDTQKRKESLERREVPTQARYFNRKEGSKKRWKVSKRKRDPKGKKNQKQTTHIRQRDLKRWKGAKRISYPKLKKYKNQLRFRREPEIRVPGSVLEFCECGKAQKRPRIVGGETTTKNEHPWQAALFYAKNDTWFCGATVINDRFVLTAAHCVQTFHKPKQVLVRLGQDNLKRTPNGRDLKVQKILMHESFDPKTLEHDIALLRLKKKMNIDGSSNLRPICLPSTTTELYEGKKAVVAGWGDIDYEGKPSKRLRTVTLKVVSNKECQASAYHPDAIKATTLCAGDRQSNTCNGDSGGPLLYENGSGYNEQIGITSFGVVCGQNDDPGGFTRVNKYLDWIQERTRDASYCSGFSFH